MTGHSCENDNDTDVLRLLGMGLKAGLDVAGGHMVSMIIHSAAHDVSVIDGTDADLASAARRLERIARINTDETGPSEVAMHVRAVVADLNGCLNGMDPGDAGALQDVVTRLEQESAKLDDCDAAVDGLMARCGFRADTRGGMAQ